MLPEEKARLKIDALLHEAGWDVCSRKEYSTLSCSVALKEALLLGKKEADYLLFLNGKAIGVLEAKRAENTLNDAVAAQAETYCKSMQNWYQSYEQPLPLVYLSNGEKIVFRNLCDFDSEYREIPKMHTPKEIVEILGIEDEYAGLPTLFQGSLRACQYQAILELERSFKKGKQRALLVLATGAGKTYTACMIANRFLTYTKTRAKRILFLVDRNNLGKQAEGEFGTFKLTETGAAFNAIYTTTRLTSTKIPGNANLVISTIQWLYSAITGIEMPENADEVSLADKCVKDTSIQIGKKTCIPPDYFDYIIVDECHRSIYGHWQAVLNYFETARIIGLTATPAPETLAFFDNNRVINYTLENSIKDGVNVPSILYRIKTKVAEEGAFIRKGEVIEVHENYDNIDYSKVNPEDKQYSKTELNRSVIDLSQIRLVLREYKDIVYTKLYPNRKPNFHELPKTLIFALNDRHAEQIVKAAREVFSGQSSDFVQKITYSVGNTNTLIRDFSNSKTFRIAVTVNLIATGTDIRPLEVLIFMRDVESESFYIQMKGRGVRSISDDKLRVVTPNADTKDFFYLIDAVGVSEHEKKVSPIINSNDLKQIPELHFLLEKISHGFIPDEYLRVLADKIARINLKADEEEQAEFTALSTCSMEQIVTDFYEALNNGSLPLFEEGISNFERQQLVRPLSDYPKAREYLLKLQKGIIIVQNSGNDELLFSDFSENAARETVSAFETYIAENKDKIQALRLIYQDKREELTYAVLKDLTDKLTKTIAVFSVNNVWNAYAVLNPKNVQNLTQKEEIEMITNIINLVRFAYKQTSQLRSTKSTIKQYFELWLGHILKNTGENLSEVQKNIAFQLAEYIAINGAINILEYKLDKSNAHEFQEMKNAFGEENLPELMQTLSKYMLAA